MSAQRDILATFCSWAKEVGYLDSESDVESLLDHFFTYADTTPGFGYVRDKSHVERIRELKEKGLLS